MAHSTLFFVHIPKTAGTSFRQGVQLLFPKRVLYDYGADSPNTSDLVRTLVHERRDLAAFAEVLESQHIAMLGGHIAYERYADLFPPERVVAFVRDPVSRLLSAYSHVTRLYGFEGSLFEFARRPQNRNQQATMLAGVPREKAMLIGVAERYQDSLHVLRGRTGWNVPELTRNLNPTRNELCGAYDAGPEIARRLTAWNEADSELYGWASRRLDEVNGPSRPLAVERTPKNPSRGVLGGYAAGRVYGWAQLLNSAGPARVRVVVAGGPPATVVANRQRDDLLRKGIHPTGEAGFELDLGPLDPGTRIRCFVDQTGLELVNSPLVVE